MIKKFLDLMKIAVFLKNEKFQNMTADNIISILENLKIYETEFINEIEDINELDFSKDNDKKEFLELLQIATFLKNVKSLLVSLQMKL